MFVANEREIQKIIQKEIKNIERYEKSFLIGDYLDKITDNVVSKLVNIDYDEDLVIELHNDGVNYFIVIADFKFYIDENKNAHVSSDISYLFSVLKILLENKSIIIDDEIEDHNDEIDSCFYIDEEDSIHLIEDNYDDDDAGWVRSNLSYDKDSKGGYKITFTDHCNNNYFYWYE